MNNKRLRYTAAVAIVALGLSGCGESGKVQPPAQVLPSKAAGSTLDAKARKARDYTLRLNRQARNARRPDVSGKLKTHLQMYHKVVKQASDLPTPGTLHNVAFYGEQLNQIILSIKKGHGCADDVLVAEAFDILHARKAGYMLPGKSSAEESIKVHIALMKAEGRLDAINLILNTKMNKGVDMKTITQARIELNRAKRYLQKWRAIARRDGNEKVKKHLPTINKALDTIEAKAKALK